jgi:hypothetical protein
MATYIGNVPVPQASQTRDRFVATAGQTTFNTSGYTVGYLDVYLNGVKLDVSDYDATDGSSVVLHSGATLDDVLDVIAFSTFEVANVDAGAKQGTFWENNTTISASYSITAGKNAGTFGPVTIADGVTVTVPDGSTWTIV